MDVTDVKLAATRAGDHPVLEIAARVGYAVSGVFHVVIGVIALKLALSGAGRPDQSGALRALADNPVGTVVLWVAVLGWLGLALWQVTEALTRGGAGDRVKAVSKTVVYLALSVTAFSYARGHQGRNSTSQTRDLTATLMSKPAGQWLVGIVGLVVIGVGVYHVYKGWKRRFLTDLQSHPGPWVEKAGRFGYIAKGVALAIVGGLFVLAAVRHRPSEATGLDGALHSLLGAPGGPVMLTLVALGLIAFGIYSFGRARRARV
jgi:type IV secretory pathway VirB2 component (pilin)